MKHAKKITSHGPANPGHSKIIQLLSKNKLETGKNPSRELCDGSD